MCKRIKNNIVSTRDQHCIPARRLVNLDMPVKISALRCLVVFICVVMHNIYRYCYKLSFSNKAKHVKSIFPLVKEIKPLFMECIPIITTFGIWL